MRRLLTAALCAAVAACSRGPAAAPPKAEFLLSSADSTFWVAAADTQVRVRGAPLTVARFGGRFYELYSADDDFSFNDALLVGERVYRRDLATGDSIVLFRDTAVTRIALAYARAHPQERPLDPHEEGDPEPATSATSEVDLLGIYGPYASFEYHIDVSLPARRPWHATRRGVLDLRTGGEVGISDIFGAAAARDVVARGRRSYESTRDSILAARAALPDDDRLADAALRRLQFDERSFTLTAVDAKPAVSFDVPGRGEGVAGNVLELDPLTMQPPPWWRDVALSSPTTDDQGDDVWLHRGYRVVARYDTASEVAHVSLADSSRREWPVATILTPLRDITWLDDSPLSATDRAQLLHAFNTAASYDENVRVAWLRAVPKSTPIAHRPSLIANASLKKSSRKSARDLRAHDAGAREQHGTCVRRGHSVHDGQDGRHCRLPA